MDDDTLVGAVIEDTKDRMTKAVAHAQSDFAGVRTGRASSGMVERLKVDYYGSEVPLQQLASFSTPEAKLLVISPFDKGAMKSIEESIGPQISLLHYVLCVMIVASEPARQVVGGRQVRHYQQLKA